MIFFLIFAQNIDCGYTLETDAVLTSTHDLCFLGKIRKNVNPVNPYFTILKWGVRGYTLRGHVIVM